MSAIAHADASTTLRYLHNIKRPDEVELVAEAFAIEPRVTAAA